MTDPQKYRWRRRVNKAASEIEGLIYDLKHNVMELNPEVEPHPKETKDEECEALAAEAVRDAIGALEGARHALDAADTHMDWERNRDIRNFPLRARKLLESLLNHITDPATHEAIAAVLALGPPRKVKEVTGGSLFTGIAGLDIGLELAGAVDSWAWQCESDPHALAVLERHYPTVHRYKDVRHINGRATRPDFICGGFPCQDISDAGPRHGIDGERSGLWHEFARIIRELRPSYVFVENVAALAKRGLDRVLGDLAALGFDAEWGCYGACEAGRPHTRDRLFVLAYSNEGPGTAGLRARPPSSWQVPGRIDPEMPPSVRVESDGELLRMADGLPREVDRLARLGNACVPQQAAFAYQQLLARVLP